MNKPPKVLVLIPCYNEQDNIVQVVERLRATCPWADYLVINDCSTDRSAELLRSHGYNAVLLQNEDSSVVENGLKYVHNDTCYPALLVIGQLIDAIKSGKIGRASCRERV